MEHLHCWKLCSRWVPRMLVDEYKRNAWWLKWSFFWSLITKVIVSFSSTLSLTVKPEFHTSYKQQAAVITVPAYSVFKAIKIQANIVGAENHICSLWGLLTLFVSHYVFWHPLATSGPFTIKPHQPINQPIFCSYKVILLVNFILQGTTISCRVILLSTKRSVVGNSKSVTWPTDKWPYCTTVQEYTHPVYESIYLNSSSGMFCIILCSVLTLHQVIISCFSTTKNYWLTSLRSNRETKDVPFGWKV